MTDLIPAFTQEQMADYSLVLSSQGIPHQWVRLSGGWILRVPAPQADAAQQAIHQYVQENKSVPESTASGNRFSLAGVWAALVLMTLHIYWTVWTDPRPVMEAFSASADHIIRQGQGYRTVTALLIHRDLPHLFGNMLGLGLFGSTVCSIFGLGVGWLMILASGTLGNWLNAAVYQSGHWSVGASTAVFGAVGILCGHRFVTRIGRAESRMRSLLPIGGGIALLGFLSAGANTDIMAHLFGFFAGLFMGTGWSRWGPQAPSNRMQWAAGAVSAAVLAAAWTKCF